MIKSRSIFGKKYLDLDIRELELEPGPSDVIVKVLACGVCGTDLNFIRDYSENYMPLGHEIAGEVVECGPLVTNVKPGDTVTVEAVIKRYVNANTGEDFTEMFQSVLIEKQ